MQCEAAACTKSVNQEGIIGNSFFSYIVCTFSLCSKFLCICCCTDFCWKEENGIRIMENPFQYSMCKFQHVQLLFSSLQLRYLIFLFILPKVHWLDQLWMLMHFRCFLWIWVIMHISNPKYFFVWRYNTFQTHFCYSIYIWKMLDTIQITT